ncbi:UNVERIFIED_CONTAM: Speckle targeted PIP5K1A-regulated poly(A) polymerase [Trichonephila clavipes]
MNLKSLELQKPFLADVLLYVFLVKMLLVIFLLITTLHSTSFMLLCNMLDKRVAPLHRFLTYWAKSHKLIGGPFKFKTYAIFLLLLYFLQTRTPPVLPSVECMFERTGFNNNFNNWSYDISKHLEKFEDSKNLQCIGIINYIFV